MVPAGRGGVNDDAVAGDGDCAGVGNLAGDLGIIGDKNAAPPDAPGIIVPVLPTLPVKVLSLTTMPDVVPVLVCGNGPV